MPFIYTDGHSREVTEDQASMLCRVGLTIPHPGVGEHGIKEGDLRLADDVSWEQVEKKVKQREALAELTRLSEELPGGYR